MSRAPAITRVEPSSGATEEISYFGEAPQAFGSMHLPKGDIRSCVVVCSSTHAELLKSYQLEVRLARVLAGQGIAVHRFHYRGDGNSEGDIRELTLPAMLATGREVRDRLVARTGVPQVAHVGVRLGGIVSAILSEESPAGTPLVLWDPVVDADAFMREALRSHAIAALKGEAKPERAEQTLLRLEKEGSIDLLGYRFTSDFYKSIKGQKLVDHPPRGRNTLIVPFGSTNTTSLEAAWAADDVDITSLEGTRREAWWLDEQADPDRQRRANILAELTANWLSEHIDG